MAGIFSKHRFKIYSTVQHPLMHDLSSLFYASDAAPGVSTAEEAFDWVFKVLYPQTKPSVANVAALPLVGNTINDYRVVLDDGDGKAAGYRWEQREGEGAPSWHKIYDMDWGQDSILAQFLLRTQDLYVYKNGLDDLDANGVPVVGIFAGQRIYGGQSAGTNLTLAANSGDGVGPSTGYVQVEDHFRPIVDNTLDLGTITEQWRDGYFASNIYVGTLQLVPGGIFDSTGNISFGNENISTSGDVYGETLTANTSLTVATQLTISAGSITDTSGTINFGTTNLTTLGTITAATNSVLADITFANGSITSVSAAINFGTNNLVTTGTLQAGDATVTRLDSDNIRLDGNTISILNANGNLILQANGTGVVDVQSPMTTLGQTVTGTVGITGQLNIDNLRLDGNVISSTNLNGNITLTPNGTGSVEVSSDLIPASDNTKDLGTGLLRWNDLFLGGSIGDGTDAITISTLLSLRDINVGVGLNYTIFWNGTKWVASAPDTEIDHGTITGLLDDDHTQYALLAGRAGGQSLIGGTAASETLTLESTAHATKGTVQTKDNFVPFTNASYVAGWQGTDLGDATHYFRDLYTKGEAKGLRLENLTSGTLPVSSAQNIGRLVWAADVNKIYVDTGSSLLAVSTSKYLSDTVWDGVQTSQTFVVSASIQDARNAIWAIHDNANDFERIYCKITAISATQVKVDVTPALPAGSYRLIGLE